MQILSPQKISVPRVPCVPRQLKAFHFAAFKHGTHGRWHTKGVPESPTLSWKISSPHWRLPRFAGSRCSRFLGHANGAGG